MVTYRPTADCEIFMEIAHTNRTKMWEKDMQVRNIQVFAFKKKMTELATL
jgi:hypothetical protein